MMSPNSKQQLTGCGCWRRHVRTASSNNMDVSTVGVSSLLLSDTIVIVSVIIINDDDDKCGR